MLWLPLVVACYVVAWAIACLATMLTSSWDGVGGVLVPEVCSDICICMSAWWQPLNFIIPHFQRGCCIKMMLQAMFFVLPQLKAPHIWEWCVLWFIAKRVSFLVSTMTFCVAALQTTSGIFVLSYLVVESRESRHLKLTTVILVLVGLLQVVANPQRNGCVCIVQCPLLGVLYTCKSLYTAVWPWTRCFTTATVFLLSCLLS